MMAAEGALRDVLLLLLARQPIPVAQRCVGNLCTLFNSGGHSPLPLVPQVYYVYGFFLLVFLILLIVTVSAR